MEKISTVALWVTEGRSGGYNLEVEARAHGMASVCIREHYGPCNRKELLDIVDAVLSDIRPGMGWFPGGGGFQLRWPEVEGPTPVRTPAPGEHA